MKRLLLYFTGTGNSLSVARTLAAKLGECEIRSIADVIKQGKPISAEEIGIITPVYMHRAPFIVLKALDLIAETEYLFAIATFGGSMGKIFEQISKRATKNNHLLNLGMAFKMPDNYLPFFEVKDYDKVNEQFAALGDSIEMAVELISQRKNLIEDRTSFVSKNIIPGPFFWSGYVLLNQLDRTFSSDKNCSGCSICAKVCPVENISMKNNRPKWNHNCEQCFACVHWCPSQSINSGFITKGKKRYHHPDITVQDIIAQRGESLANKLEQ